MARVLNGLTALSDALYTLVGEPKNVRRVVIDIQSGHAPIVHIERFGDESVIDVVRALAGVEVTRSTGEATTTANECGGPVWDSVGAMEWCAAHGPHPHNGRRCLDCPTCVAVPYGAPCYEHISADHDAT